MHESAGVIGHAALKFGEVFVGAVAGDVGVGPVPGEAGAGVDEIHQFEGFGVEAGAGDGSFGRGVDASVVIPGEEDIAGDGVEGDHEPGVLGLDVGNAGQPGIVGDEFLGGFADAGEGFVLVRLDPEKASDRSCAGLKSKSHLGGYILKCGSMLTHGEAALRICEEREW